MTIKSNGPLSFTEIHDEFKSLGSNFGSKPYLLSEYYNLPAGIGLPTSGEIKFSDFYGKSNIIYVVGDDWVAISDSQINSKYNRNNCDLWESLQAMGYTDPTRNYDIQIPLDYWLWSSTTSKAGLTIPASMTGLNVIRNRGNIIGMGGRGGNSNTAGGAGGPALEVLGEGPLVVFNFGYVAGGGGGGAGARGTGAGGAGGGAGGTGSGSDNNAQGGSGGILNASGTSGGNASQAGGGSGGGAGGGGGGADNEGGCEDSGAAGGGGGGRILPGVGGAGGGGEAGENGGAGGSGNNAGGTAVSNGGGGGGGWGKSGGTTGTRAGGTGGQAIKTDRTFSAVNLDNGVFWGSV